MRKFLLAVLAGAALVLLTSPARADVKPHALFGDGMVVQRGAPVVIWGKADPEEKVESVAMFTDGGPKFEAKVSTTADKNGNWKVEFGLLEFKNMKPGDAPVKGTITLTGKNTVTINDVYVGDVWVCSGQSNMEMGLGACLHAKEDAANSKNPLLRLFTVPHAALDEPTTEVKAKWVECGPGTVGGFSGVAYYFGRDIQKSQGIPIGLIHTSWGGTIAEAWATRGSLEANPEFKALLENYEKTNPFAPANYAKTLQKYKAEVAEYSKLVDKLVDSGKRPPAGPTLPRDPVLQEPNRPCVLFDGMIAPLQPFAIKGAIWYQGESNAGRAYQYRSLFPTMIQSWRDSWKQPDLPFYFVQLAPWDPQYDPNKKQPADSAWAELREAQLLTSQKLPHTGMAVITDTVPPNEAKDIHPKMKEPSGARLALCARALTYGEKVEYSGPLCDNVNFEGDKAVLHFSHLGKGLEVRGDELQGFTIAGEDKVFHDAQAAVKGNKVVVWSDKVSKPVAVRFGWTNFPTVNLFNRDGLPASPFRTDDFPITTGPKK